MGALAGDVETALQTQTAAMLTGTRNRIANPTFTQAQLPVGTAGIADSWTYLVDSITGVTNTRNTLAVTSGLPEWVSGSMTQATASNAAGIARYVAMAQAIPDIRSVSGATVIVSFYAKATVGTPKIGANFYYRYGTGGTPSADVNGVGQSVTISTSWTRYSLTFALLTASGKTLGTNGDDTTSLQLWTSAGTNWNTNSGSIGLQTSTIEITGVQVERNFLTPLEVRSVDSNLRNSSEFGKWTDFPAVIKQGAAAMATTVNWARYVVVGKLCLVNLSLTAGAAGTAAATIEVLSNATLPTPRQTGGVAGNGFYDDIGTGFNLWAARLQPGTGTPRWTFYADNGTTVRTTPTIASGDSIHVFSFYEIA
jgi:hypothetical protein